MRVAIFRHHEERPNLEASAFEGVSDIKSEGNDSLNWDHRHHDDGNSDNHSNEGEDEDGGENTNSGDEAGSDQDESSSTGTLDEANEMNEDHGVNKIDKDLLYSVMTQLVSNYPRKLDVNYGNINGIDQSWECVSGEEV